MIVADKREYRKGYLRHYEAYKNLPQNYKSSKNLLLVYSVECGLKYLLMNSWGILSVKEIEEEDTEKKGLLGDHDLKRMLKELGQQGMVEFSPFKTCHGDTVDIRAYHQFCRYGINIDDKTKKKEEQFEAELKLVADWIRMEM